MDIVNELRPDHFARVDDLLAFISIYDDRQRLEKYHQHLDRLAPRIAGAVCLEAGAGLGLFAEKMARLKAARVYAVESNPLLCQLARERLAPYPNVEVVERDVRQFIPPEPVDFLVHELFGQMLYDEDLSVLEELPFQPRYIFPNQAMLRYGLVSSEVVVDDTVTPSVLQKLEGVLVSGLFDEQELPLLYPVLSWKPGHSQDQAEVDLQGREGDVLYFGLQIYHDGELVCQAGECSNWSYVWTPRCGERFELSFRPAERGHTVHFRWLG